jgi:vitamin B12 transporter
MKSALFLTAALCAVAPLSAHAQTDPDAAPAELETVVVTASRSGEAAPVAAIPSSVTVFGPETLEARGTRQVSDLLRDAPGVAVSRVPGSSQVRLRGSEANHVLVLIDGIEASDPYAGEFDFGLLPADESARVEVLRGQQSSLYGSDAIGGVIHYITPTGREAPGLRARIEAGSFGTVNTGARIAGASGTWDGALSATLQSTNGTPNARGGSRDLAAERLGLSGKGSWSPADNIRVLAVGRINRSDEDFNDQEFNPASPSFGLVVDSPGVRVENQAVYGLLRAELDLLDGRWRHALSAQIANTDRDAFEVSGPSFGSEGRRTKASYETSLDLTTPGALHRLTGAVDLEREQFRNTDASDFTFGGRREVESAGVVGQYELAAGALSVGASLRHDANDLFEDATTYRIGASYQFDNGLRLRAAAGSGVKNPGFFELFGFFDGRYIGNPDLKPERSEGYELGVEQSFRDGRVTAGVVYFDNRLQDEIFVSFPAPTFVATPGNRDTESEQRGVEAFATARLGQGWSVDAAYTGLRARENGQVEVRRPETTASLAVAWRDPAERGGGALVLRYNGEAEDLAFTDPSFIPVRAVLDDYLLINLNADLALTPRVSVFGRIENLLDERYEEVFSFVSPGVAAYAGLRARF